MKAEYEDEEQQLPAWVLLVNKLAKKTESKSIDE